HCGGGRSALLRARSWLLCRPHLLRLETRTLGIAERPASLDPRPLRRARRILDGCLAFRLMVNDWLNQAPACQTKTHGCGQTTQSVAHASTEIDRRRFRHVTRWTRHFADGDAERDDLRENL